MKASPLDTNTAPATKFSQLWGLMRPAAHVVKGSARLLQRTLLGTRHTEHEHTSTTPYQEEWRQLLHLRLKKSTSAAEWRSTAKELDILENNEAWKFETESGEFDAPLIETKLKQLDDAREACDLKQMLNLIRTTLSRDLGGIGNTRLYTQSYIGTKDLIERYIDSALALIRCLVAMTKNDLPPDVDIATILGQVVSARQAFGRSALLLSGGGTFGMNHIGVLKALFDVKSLPRIISGASAGSIVASILCTLTDGEIPTILANFAHNSNLAVFEDKDKPDGILKRLHRLLTQGAWIDNRHLIDVMQHMLGDMTFQEAYNRTRRILNICVSSASVYELPRILNYITAPNVMIWSAVAASCSVPLLFAAASLLIKDPISGEYAPWNPTPQQWIDGSVEGDIPMTRLAEMFNVNHFIVSQVNPHVVPFLVNEDRSNAEQVQSDAVPGWISTIAQLAKDEALHGLHMLAEVGIFPNIVTKLSSVLSQKYSGHITILPQVKWKDLPLILTNPTPEFMEKALLYGERATWPKLSRVRNACAIELELDSAVQELRARLVFGNTGLARPRGYPTMRPKFRASRQKLKRGYTITTNADFEPFTGNHNEDDVHQIGRKNALKHNKQLMISHSFHQFEGAKNIPKSACELKFNLIYPPIHPATDSSNSSVYSPHTSDSDPESSTESISKGDGYSTAISSPSVVDFPQPVTAKCDHVLATSPTMSCHVSYDRFAAALGSKIEVKECFSGIKEPVVAKAWACIALNAPQKRIGQLPVLYNPTSVQ